jgi:hypothetical protein
MHTSRLLHTMGVGFFVLLPAIFFEARPFFLKPSKMDF